MAYNRVNWKDGQSGGTPISASNLNNMDSYIEKVCKGYLEVSSTVEQELVEILGSDILWQD